MMLRGLLVALLLGAASSLKVPTQVSSRRDALSMAGMGAAAVLGLSVPSAANAMIVPGLNGPGLVPAKKVNRQSQIASGAISDDLREGDINHFWNPKGIMNSVPKVKGIITPKSTCGFDDKKVACGR